MGYTKLEYLRKAYPAGTRIKLLKMEDCHAVPPMTMGTVQGVDDAENIMMLWDNGSCLSLIEDLDKFKRVTEQD